MSLNYKGEDLNPPKAKMLQKATEASACNHKAAAQLSTMCSSSTPTWCPQNKAIEEQIDCKPWTDLYSDEHTEKHHKSQGSFMEYMTFHLLTTFRNNAAEMGHFYISNGLKKPNRISI